MYIAEESSHDKLWVRGSFLAAFRQSNPGSKKIPIGATSENPCGQFSGFVKIPGTYTIAYHKLSKPEADT